MVVEARERWKEVWKHCIWGLDRGKEATWEPTEQQLGAGREAEEHSISETWQSRSWKEASPIDADHSENNFSLWKTRGVFWGVCKRKEKGSKWNQHGSVYFQESVLRKK